MKKLFIKSGVMLMLALTMVSCKKDLTEELEASNESSNKGALLPPNANNYYIDSIIINDGTSRVVKFDYDVPNKKIMIYKKSISSPTVLYDTYKYNNNWLLQSVDNDYSFSYNSASIINNINFNTGFGSLVSCSMFSLSNKKPKYVYSPAFPICFFGWCDESYSYSNTYNYYQGNLIQIKSLKDYDDSNLLLKYTYSGGIINPFKNLKCQADFDLYDGNSNQNGSINPSSLILEGANLPFNFSSNLLPTKVVRQLKLNGATQISTLNSVVNSTFLNLPVNMTISGNLPGVSGTYNANITFSYKLI